MTIYDISEMDTDLGLKCSNSPNRPNRPQLPDKMNINMMAHFFGKLNHYFFMISQLISTLYSPFRTDIYSFYILNFYLHILYFRYFVPPSLSGYRSWHFVLTVSSHLHFFHSEVPDSLLLSQIDRGDPNPTPTVASC